MASLQQLLQPNVLTKTISRVAGMSDWLAVLFGVQPGGKNVLNFGHGRTGAYHIYNNVRKVARGRTPGTAAGRRAPNPMGRVTFDYPRMHDSVSLLAEMLHNLAKISDPTVRDAAGADMLSRQTDTLAQLAANWRKAMLVGMLRDSLYIGIEGDDMFFDFEATAGVLPVLQAHARMPAGNKNQLNMTGTGNIINASWSTATTNIPNHLGQINAAFQQICGGHLNSIIVPWAVWNNVIVNEFVAAIHGSANAPFKVLERESVESELAKSMKNVFRAELNVLPGVTWYITDEGLEIGKPGSETFKKIVPDTNALFVGTDPSGGAIACYEGSEPIAEYDNGPETVKTGLASWSVKRSNPTSTELYVLDNALVTNHVPASTAFGTVIF